MNRRFALALLAALTLPAPGLAGAEGNTGIVRGHVYDLANGKPVCGALVTVVSNTDHRMLHRSDASGFFVFLAVMPGISRVLIDGSSGKSAAREVQVSANLTSEVNLSIDAATAARAKCERPAAR